jgi:hypothetical protein
MTRKVLIDRASKRASQEIVLGAGLESVGATWQKSLLLGNSVLLKD